MILVVGDGGVRMCWGNLESPSLTSSPLFAWIPARSPLPGHPNENLVFEVYIDLNSFHNQNCTSMLEELEIELFDFVDHCP